MDLNLQEAGKEKEATDNFLTAAAFSLCRKFPQVGEITSV